MNKISENIYLKDSEKIINHSTDIISLDIYIIKNDYQLNKILEKIKVIINKLDKTMSMENATSSLNKIRTLSENQIKKISSLKSNKALANLIIAGVISFSNILIADDRIDKGYDNSSNYLMQILDNDSWINDKTDVQIQGNFNENDQERISELYNDINDMSLLAMKDTANLLKSKVPSDGDKIQKYFDDNIQIQITFDSNRKNNGSAEYALSKNSLTSNGHIEEIYNSNKDSGNKYGIIKITLSIDNMDDIFNNKKEILDIIYNTVVHEATHLSGKPIYDIYKKEIHINQTNLPEKLSLMVQEELGREISVDTTKQIYHYATINNAIENKIIVQNDIMELTIDWDNFNQQEKDILKDALNFTKSNALQKFIDNKDYLYIELSKIMGKRDKSNNYLEYGTLYIDGEGIGDTLFKLAKTYDEADIDIMHVDFRGTIADIYLTDFYKNVKDLSLENNINSDMIFTKLTEDFEIDKDFILRDKPNKLNKEIRATSQKKIGL